MRPHFERLHKARFSQYFGVVPPVLHPCPFVDLPFGCTVAPFQSRERLEDHLSQQHNVVQRGWSTIFNKQKRRSLHYLLADHTAEASRLNELIDRVVAAETAQPAGYVSRHGLPLRRYEVDPARVTDRSLRMRKQKEDVAAKLCVLRCTADMMGGLLGGGTGTWEQVAVELEARVAGFGAGSASDEYDGDDDDDDDEEDEEEVEEEEDESE